MKTVEMGTSHRTFGTPGRTPLLLGHGRRGEDRVALPGGRRTSTSRWLRRGRARRVAAAGAVGPRGQTTTGGRSRELTWGSEAFNSYFGYPSSMPPVYAKARGTRKWTGRAARPGRGADGQGEVEEGAGKAVRAERAPRRPRRRVSEASGRDLFPPQGPAGSAPRSMEFHRVIGARRSLARLSQRPVEMEKIERMLDAARWSPLVRQPPAVAVRRGGGGRSVPRGGRGGPRRGQHAWAKRAPVLIAAGARREDAAVVESRDYFLLDTGMALMSLLYRAVDQGCWSTRWRDGRRDRCRAALGLPEDFTPAAVVAVGYAGKSGDLDEAAEEGREPGARKPLGRSPSVRCGGAVRGDAAFLPAKVYETELQARFGDTDAMGHVNNAKVVTYLELGRMQFFADVMGAERVEDIRFILAEVSCRYRIPICFTIASSCGCTSPTSTGLSGSAATCTIPGRPRFRRGGDGPGDVRLHDGAPCPHGRRLPSPRPGTTSEDKGARERERRSRPSAAGKQRRVPLREGRVEEREHSELPGTPLPGLPGAAGTAPG